LANAQAKEINLNLSDADKIGWMGRATFRVAIDKRGKVAVELSSVTASDGSHETPCKGVLRLSPKKDSKGVWVSKHQFPFAHLADTKAWVQSTDAADALMTVGAGSLKFDGYLDLPFVEPDPPREGFDRESAIQTSILLKAFSSVVIEEIGQMGGEHVQKCDELYNFLVHESLENKQRILQRYPLRVFGTDLRITVNELIDRCSTNKDLRVMCLSDSAPQNMRQMARTLSTLDNYCVIELDGPHYWRGYIIEALLEGTAGATNMSSATNFTSVLEDNELGVWRTYRALFSAALNEVIGPGRQLQIARIEPPDIALVVPEGAGIVYANYNNAEVQGLPESGLVGPDLESKIRSWAFGRIQAGQLEEALTKQGKLLVVQKVTSLTIVNDPNTKQYVPQPEDQLLLVRDGKQKWYGLRVSYLCQPHLKGFVDSGGKISYGYSARLTWVGNVFYFTLQPRDDSLPTLILEFKTSAVLRNGERDGALEGAEEHDFRVESYPGPGLTGPVSFFVLPWWIGDLLNEQRSRRGTIQISMFSQILTVGQD
jgi:hypothetical protein